MTEQELRACYRVLEVSPSASLAEVREAYRVLSRVWHPDRFAGNPDLLARATARQQELNAAYQRLQDAYARGVAPLDAAAPTSKPPRATTAEPKTQGASAATAAADQTGSPPTARSTWRRKRVLIVAASAFSLLIVLLLWSQRDRRVLTSSGDVVRAITLAVGGGHACAASGNRAWCWGDNESGQRGGADGATSSRATSVTLPDSIVKLTVGLNHSCALGARGAVYCWGANHTGQLGDRSLDDRATPSTVRINEPFVAISTLANHTCALSQNGTLYCWGNDADGQLGAGRMVASCRWDQLRFACSDRPERVVGNETWRAVATGGSHTCAVDASGVVHCWGSNRSGQLGASATQSCRGPGGEQPCRRSPAPVAGIDVPVIAIAAGAAHTCALDAEGTVRCWGANLLAESGVADTVRIAVPTALDTRIRFVSLAAGAYHTCATTDEGALYCWGRDQYGELRGEARERCDGIPCARRPVGVARGVAEVAAGFGVTCIRRTTGDVVCWGRGDPQVQAGPRALPVTHTAAGGLRRLLAELRWRAGTAKRFLHRNLVAPLQRL